MTPTEAMLLIAKAEFKPFTKADYESFNGVESDNPMLGEYEDWVIVIDGNTIQFTDVEMEKCYQFKLDKGIRIF